MKTRKLSFKKSLNMSTNNTKILQEEITNFMNEHLQINLNILEVVKRGQTIYRTKLGSETDKGEIMKSKYKPKN